MGKKGTEPGPKQSIAGRKGSRVGVDFEEKRVGTMIGRYRRLKRGERERGKPWT